MGFNHVSLAKVVTAVPVGRDNAMRASAIHKVVDCWAETSVSNMLRHLAESGRICCTKEAIPTGFALIYWREAA